MPENATWSRLVTAHRDAGAEPCGSVPAHEPVAAILACSDARVPPSVVFDQPAGSLFVVRIAGNTASPAAVASLDYAVAELGVDLIIVLGHSECGAVTSAAAGVCDGYVAPIVEPICALVRRRPRATVDELVADNVEATMAALAEHDGPAGAAIRSGAVTVRGAVHDLALGQLKPQPPTDQPPMEMP